MHILFSLVSYVSVSLNDAATATAAEHGTATATAAAAADDDDDDLMWRTSTSTVYAMSLTIFLGLFTCCVAGIQYKIHRMQQIAVRPIFRNTNTNDAADAEDEDDGSINDDNGTCTSREIIPIAKNGHWLLGHLIVLHKDGDFRNGQYKTCIEQADPSTGLCSMWFLSIPTVSVLLAADVQQVLKGSSYRKSSSWLLTTHQNALLGPHALVTLMGKEWKYYRTAVHKSFTPLALQESQQIINSVGRTLTQSLLRAIHSNSTSTTIEKEGNDKEDTSKSSTTASTNYYETEVLALMKMATIDVFGLSSLGYDLQSCETLQPSKVATAFDYLTDEFTHRMGKPWNITTWLYQIPTTANVYHAKQQRILRSFIHDLVAKGRQELAQGTTPEDTKKTEFLLTLLKQSAKDEKHPISDTALSDIIMTLLFGGYDTTSITLTYAIYLLTLHPEIEQRVVQEITSVLDQDTNEQHHLQKHQELPYTRAVIYETLRLYPPAPVTLRNLEKEMILHKTIPIPADTMMYVPIWSIQRDARNFPQPTTFRPDRWVQLDPVTNTYIERFPNDDDDNNDDAKNEKKHETTHDRSSNYIPAANRDGFCSFSAGARNCVGKVLAMQEAVTILAQLLYKLQFELIAPDYEVQPILSSFIQKPHDGLPMRIKPRERNRGRERETEK